ncbi:transcriptional regulator family: Fungal Specific TF [Aspergillus niger]|nr:transcriptional regulator family: Fungal Specific TF [Aspergillus niger]
MTLSRSRLHPALDSSERLHAPAGSTVVSEQNSASKSSLSTVPTLPLGDVNDQGHLGCNSVHTSLPTSSVTVPGHTTPVSATSTDTTSNLIREELASHAHLSPDRVWVLQSALDLVGKFVSASQSADETHDNDQGSVQDTFTPDEIPLELFYMLLHVQGESAEGALLHWPDHISSKTFERMCAALGSRAANGQLALRYSLCVLTKATVYVSRWLRFGAPDGMLDSLEKSRNVYIATCLRYLQEIDFTRPPSLSMLQALLSGLLGETSRSWFLTAVASKVLVALGYHQSSLKFLESDEGFEVRQCIYWCYYMDKTLSMLLVRPSSLPNLPYQPSSLVYQDTANPLSRKVKILLRLSQVQDRYLHIFFKNPHLDETNLPQLVDSLHSELTSISVSIAKYRSDYVSNLIWESEWDAVDFTFYSVATTVLRLNSLFLHDYRKREECVSYARSALRSMQACQKHISTTSRSSADSLIWTVLLYPLTPFFVLFCNVVASSNIFDLDLLNEVTVTIANIPDQCTFSTNLQHLLSQLISLCSNLHEVQARLVLPVPDNHQIIDINITAQPLPNSPRRSGVSETITCNTPTDEQAQPPVQAPAVNTAHAAKEGSVWDDELLWELFNIQPSVEWFDVDYCNET